MKETKTMNIKWKPKMKENGRRKLLENESDVCPDQSSVISSKD